VQWGCTIAHILKGFSSIKRFKFHKEWCCCSVTTMGQVNIHL
jgi:hypothetical protein